jgi:hypothetical protein
VNLFALGWTPSPGRVDLTAAVGALHGLVEQLGFLDVDRISSWLAPRGNVGVAWVTHSPEQTGAARYVHADANGLALFAGRPFRWTEDGEADGRSPLDASFYCARPETWADTLDGRCFAAAYDGRAGKLVVYTDPLGSYPAYAAEVAGTHWIGNSAELLRALLGTTAVDPSVLASVFDGGWSLRGDPLWHGVRRLPRGRLSTYGDDGAERARELLPIGRVGSMFGAGFRADEAARTAAAAAGALADWPGRSNVLQLSGGRDSRVVLAAALRSGVRLEAVTSGRPGSPDVQVARLLSREAGIAHARREYDPDGVLFGAPHKAATLLMLMCSGTFSLNDAGGFRARRHEGALPLWLSGQGGEIARTYYGVGHDDREVLVTILHKAFTGRAVARGPRRLARLRRHAHAGSRLLSPAGSELVERQLRDWVDVHLAGGIPPRDLPDAFYVLNRMANWAGPGHGWGEYSKGDTVSPLWCARLLPQLLGGSHAERTDGTIPLRLIEVLSPALTRLPFEEEIPADTAPSDPFMRIVDEVTDTVLSQPEHPAWDVLSRRSVERLLVLDPSSLDHDTLEWTWKPAVWRLASVFMGLPRDSPRERARTWRRSPPQPGSA